MKTEPTGSLEAKHSGYTIPTYLMRTISATVDIHTTGRDIKKLSLRQ